MEPFGRKDSRPAHLQPGTLAKTYTLSNRPIDADGRTGARPAPKPRLKLKKTFGEKLTGKLKKAWTTVDETVGLEIGKAPDLNSRGRAQSTSDWHVGENQEVVDRGRVRFAEMERSGKRTALPGVSRSKSAFMTQSIRCKEALKTYLVVEDWICPPEYEGNPIPMIEKNDLCIHIPEWDNDLDDDWVPVVLVSSQELGFVSKYYLQDVEPGSFQSQSWFFGRSTFQEASMHIYSNFYHGAFLVWTKQEWQGGTDFDLPVLTQQYQGQVYHSKIQQTPEQMYHLQNKDQDKFPDICQLVAFYQAQQFITQPCKQIAEILDIKQLGNWEADPAHLQRGRELGRGNFGSVTLGTYYGSEVAIKEMNPEKVSMGEFKQEVIAMKKLMHPNIVKLHAVCSDEQHPKIIMEFMKDGSLQEFVKNGCRERYGSERVSFLQFKMICNQIISGMVHMERLKFCHRDLRTANVLLNIHPNNQIECKVADFGLSRKRNDNGQDIVCDEEAQLPIRWMAPEILGGQYAYTPKADVWSFGMLIVEILTGGKFPFYFLRNNTEVFKYAYREQKMHPIPEFTGNEYEAALIGNVLSRAWQYDFKLRARFIDLQKLFTE